MATTPDIHQRTIEIYNTLYGPSRNPESEGYKAALATMREVDEKYPLETYAPLEVKEYTLKMNLDRIRYLYEGLPVYYQARYRLLLYHFFKPAEVDEASRLELGVKLQALRDRAEKKLQSVLWLKKAQDELADCLAPVTRFPLTPTTSTTVSSTTTSSATILSTSPPASTSTSTRPTAGHSIKIILREIRLKNRIKTALGPSPSYAEIQSYKRREADLSRDPFMEHVATYAGLWAGIEYLQM
ncbi:hypothetical protein ACEPPN_008092 [Leptodophora sp. 'Broadleaf-Isolate-01']